MATEAQDHPNRPSTHLRINAFTHLRAYKAQPAQKAQTINLEAKRKPLRGMNLEL